MANLGTPAVTAEIIKKYNFTFQKKYGQNFLVDTNILKNIVAFAEITNEDCVVEIGPGIGTLTQYLAERAREVLAVEIDKNLIPILKETLSEYQNVSILNEDILKVDLLKFTEERNKGCPIKIVANLPYYITTPIIMNLFEGHAPVSDITIMVQKEVADRMQVGPGNKDYGALSLAVQYYAKPKIVMNVSPHCFIPRPNVGSSVIRLIRYDVPPVEVCSEKKFFSIIHAAFNQRRKTLANALSNSETLTDSDGERMKVSRQQVYDALEKMGLSMTIRGEALNLKEFAQLCNLL